MIFEIYGKIVPQELIDNIKFKNYATNINFRKRYILNIHFWYKRSRMEAPQNSNSQMTRQWWNAASLNSIELVTPYKHFSEVQESK